MRRKCRWIRIIDAKGESYEFEDCEMTNGPIIFTVYYKAPIGIVKKAFIKRNLVCYEFLPEKEE